MIKLYRGELDVSVWGKNLAAIWTNNVAPSRPSYAEMCVYTQYLRKVQTVLRRPIKLLILGSTPEFRDWGYEENLLIHVVDKSRDYYEEVSREIRHKNLSEKVYYFPWEDMYFQETFDVIIGDLSIGNIEQSKFERFLKNISQAMSDEGVFLGKSFLWHEDEPIKTPKQIIDEYATSTHIHPYTFINHQLGLYCLDKSKRTIDFGKMYDELEILYNTNYIDNALFSFFKNVGWNTEMKFKFFAPSQSEFIECVNRTLQFVEFVHTSDIYTNVFPIYVIRKKEAEEIL